MAQNYTSANTSINRTKLPAVYRNVSFRGRTVYDYGCGKYIGHIIKHLLSEDCASYLPYDPYNQSPTDNAMTDEIVTKLLDNDVPVDMVCSNVLNVIDDEDEIRHIANGATSVVIKGGGTAYFTVYEGDRSGVGRRTGEDQYQRNEPLKSYLRFFDGNPKVSVKAEKGMIVVRRNS